PFGFLEDAARAAELLAEQLGQEPFARGYRIPETEEGNVRKCSEELRTAIATLTFWRDYFAGNERDAREVRSRLSQLDSPPAADIALALEYFAQAAVSDCDAKKAGVWANRLACDLREAVTGSRPSPSDFRTAKSKARAAIRKGEPSRVVATLALAGFGE